MFLFRDALLIALVLFAHLLATCSIFATANYLLAGKFTKFLTVLKMTCEA